MASRGGPAVQGSDGTDFMHRQKVASQYQLSAVNKSRLKTCIFFHFLLFFVMLIKLFPVILDKAEIFVLEIEELRVPKPVFFEYWWCVSVVVAFIGLSAIRKNNVQSMQIYMGGTLCNGVVPVICGFAYYFSDVLTYLQTRSYESIQTWQGQPYCILWYGFLLIAIQIHGFSLYFSSKLITNWTIKKSH